MIRAWLMLGILLLASAHAYCDPLAQRLQQAGFDQHLGAQLPLQTGFRDDTGRSIRLGEYFTTGRPVVLAFAYYRCRNLCESVLAGIFSDLAKTGYAGGKDFELVVVGIDPREAAGDAARKKSAIGSRYPFPGFASHAHFLTGDPTAIHAVTSVAGFRYVYDPRLDQYVHAAGLLVATPTGVVSRYLFGLQFAPTDLRLALVEASGNRIGSITDKLLLLCCRYDPQTGKYGLLIMDLLRWTGGAMAVALAVFVVGSVRSERRRATTAGEDLS
jgi:protein SCO1/2